MTAGVIDLPRRLDAFLDRVEDTARADNEARRALARVLDGGLADLPRDVTEEERREVVLAQVHARHEHRIAMHEVAAEVRLLRDTGQDVTEAIGVLELLPLYHEIRTTLNEDPATTDAFVAISREPGPARSAIEAMLVADDDLDSIPDPVPLVDDLFAMDSIAAIYGRSGKGKSFLAILLAYCVALGRDFQGRITKRGPVLYVAAEGQGGLKRRRAAYREHYEVTESAPVTWLAGVVNMLAPVSVAMLAEVVAGMTPRPKLIVLDTLARLSPGGKEDAEDIGQFINAMDALRAATGACVVAVHHAGKDEGRGARGHSSFEAAMDTMIEVGSTSPGKITALVTKQKDFCSGGESMDFTLEPAAGSVTAVPAFGLTHEAEMTGAKATAYDAFLDIVVDAGITATDWQTSTEGVSRRTFYRARAALIDEGKVEQRGTRYFLPNKSVEEILGAS